jgi:hypothetical protein
MTALREQIAWALLRGVVVAVVSLLIALPLRNFLFTLPRRARAAVWIAVLAPYVTPSLLVGYAYAPAALAFLRQPAWSGFLYGVILLLKLTPLATVVLYFAPPPLSGEASFCYHLLQRRGLLDALLFRLRGGGLGPVIAFVVVFLFGFSEFELASMWNIKTWAVTIFDRHAGGLPPGESLRLVIPPVFIEAGILVMTVMLLVRDRWSAASPGRVMKQGRGWRWLSCFYLFLGVTVVALAPLAALLMSGFAGFPSLLQNFAAARDMGASFLFAFAASCTVSFAAWFLAKRTVAALAAAIAGLFGGLPIALAIVAVFQFAPLRSLYDTPLPLLLALTLVLFPTAWLLRLVLGATRPGPALRLAEILGHRRLLWDLKIAREFWAAYLLFCLAYFELTASAIAAPVGMTPVIVRLYNLMHYGRTSVLSALLCVSLFAPLSLLLFLFVGRACAKPESGGFSASVLAGRL